MSERIEVIRGRYTEVVRAEDAFEEIARARIEIEEPARQRRATGNGQLVRCDERIVRDRAERRDGFDRTKRATVIVGPRGARDASGTRRARLYMAVRRADVGFTARDRVDDRGMRMHEELAREEAEDVEPLRRHLQTRDEITGGAIALDPSGSSSAALFDRLRAATTSDEGGVIDGGTTTCRDRERGARSPHLDELDGGDGRHPCDADLSTVERADQLSITGLDHRVELDARLVGRALA